MTKPFKIWIEDKETYIKVVKQMNKDGIRWPSGNCASHRIDLYNVPIALFVDSDNILSWGTDKSYFKKHEYNEITPEEYLKEDKTMTKADLKDWMIVEDNRGRKYIVDRVHEVLLEYGAVDRENRVFGLRNFTNDLCRMDNSFYITRIFEPTHVQLSYIFDRNECMLDMKLIWIRPEPAVEMTIAEIEEKLGIKNLKIVKENENES